MSAELQPIALEPETCWLRDVKEKPKKMNLSDRSSRSCVILLR